MSTKTDRNHRWFDVLTAFVSSVCLLLSVPAVAGAVSVADGVSRFPWYLSRASGILAFALLTLSTAWGLVMSSRAFPKIVRGADAYEWHRSLSFASLSAVILHFGSLFFDPFVQLTLSDAFIPFFFARDGLVSVSGFDMRMPVAFGVVSFYLIVILVLTAEFRAKLPPRAWRVIHYASFAAYPLFLAHGFMSGTDSGEGWMRAIYASSAVLVGCLVLCRIWFRNILPLLRRRIAGSSS